MIWCMSDGVEFSCCSGGYHECFTLAGCIVVDHPVSISGGTERAGGVHQPIAAPGSTV